MSGRISGANILFICICAKTEFCGSVSNSYNMHCDRRAAATSGSSQRTSTPDTSRRLFPYAAWCPAKPRLPNMGSPSGCFKVPVRPQMHSAPIRQGSQIPGYPQTQGTKTKYPYRHLSPNR